MKKITIFILCIASAFTIASCEKFFDRAPEDKLSSSSFFRSEDDLLLYTNGLINTGLPSASSITFGEDLFTDLCGTRESKDFYYPDGTQPTWREIDILQRMFMKWFNQLRLKQVVTFPVETLAMVHDGNDIIDKEYKDFCAEMYAEGHSFFTYVSDSADSLASCCRLKNELTENTFSPTSGLTGVMTGSCNVITLNINRILQDYWRLRKGDHIDSPIYERDFYDRFADYLSEILERVYKYHIAYKTMLYDLEDKKMFAASNGGYISISKLYSTIGINGLNEAAEFLGISVSNNSEYFEFLQLILGTIKEQNKNHNIKDSKRPFLFNSEVVPKCGGHIKPLLIDLKLLNKDNKGQARETCAA